MDKDTTSAIMKAISQASPYRVITRPCAPLAELDAKIPVVLGSYSLLGQIEYTPSERNQGACGNCWVWAGTSVMEVALNSQEGIKDRLSIQYINSNYNSGSGTN